MANDRKWKHWVLITNMLEKKKEENLPVEFSQCRKKVYLMLHVTPSHCWRRESLLVFRIFYFGGIQQISRNSLDHWETSGAQLKRHTHTHEQPDKHPYCKDVTSSKLPTILIHDVAKTTKTWTGKYQMSNMCSTSGSCCCSSSCSSHSSTTT